MTALLLWGEATAAAVAAAAALDSVWAAVASLVELPMAGMLAADRAGEDCDDGGLWAGEEDVGVPLEDTAGEDAGLAALAGAAGSGTVRALSGGGSEHAAKEEDLEMQKGRVCVIEMMSSGWVIKH